jgi:N-acetylneuraminic acid mutarotase
MSKSIALLLVLIFLMASCIIVVKPALSSADVVEDSWTSKAPMHEARSSLGVAVVNGKIYAIGGSTRSGGSGNQLGPLPVIGGVVGTNEEYDPVTDTWTYKASMPTPREGFGVAVYQNKIYCIGGGVYTTSGETGVNEVYDPATDTWETKAAMPTARMQLQANVVNGKIYLIGGEILSSGLSYSTLNEVYDPATDSWTTKAPMPTTAASHVSAVVDNKIHVLGGLSKSEYSMMHQIYDPETDTWTQGVPSPSGVTYGAAGATTGINAPKRIYVLGNKWGLWEGEPPFTVRVYDSENDSWTFGADVPTKRECFGVAVVNDRLYTIGGQSQAYQDLPYSIPYGPSVTPYATNEQYTPIGYGTVPPRVSVVSPENKNYTSSNVSLIFAVNKQTSWLGYSLDGQKNVTITNNTTLAGLSSGLHNVTVYAKDAFENMGASETVIFNVTEPFPTALVVAASVATFALAAVGVLVYFRKRKHLALAA